MNEDFFYKKIHKGQHLAWAIVQQLCEITRTLSIYKINP